MQAAAAGLLLFAAWQKLTGQPVAVETFAALRLGQLGRVSAGITEALSAILICLPTLVWAGALMGISQLAGAVLFHALVLRFSLSPMVEAGQLTLAVAGMVACAGVLMLRLLGK